MNPKHVAHKQFAIKGMHCAACSSRIEKAVAGLEGIESVSVNLATETMDLTWNQGEIQPENIAARINELGFEMVIEDDHQPERAEMALKGMHCAACSSRIEKVVGAMNGVSRAEVNLAAETGFFVFDPAKTSRRAIREVIGKLGFEAIPLTTGGTRFARQQKEMRQRLTAMKQRLIAMLILVIPLL
ncbi:MAG: copper ion binding protein, partial [Desulfobulbales bacterium]